MTFLQALNEKKEENKQVSMVFYVGNAPTFLSRRTCVERSLELGKNTRNECSINVAITRHNGSAWTPIQTS